MSQGNIVQCIGAVVDIQFPRDGMPRVYDALLLDKSEEHSGCEPDLMFEVEQQLGDGVVRAGGGGGRQLSRPVAAARLAHRRGAGAEHLCGAGGHGIGGRSALSV